MAGFYTTHAQVVVRRNVTVIKKTPPPPRIIIAPPRPTVVVAVAPKKYSIVYVGNVPYYYEGGVFYIKEGSAENYKQVQPPLGAVIASLPEDAKQMTIDGTLYYESKNIVYKKIVIDGKDLYEVVGTN